MPAPELQSGNGPTLVPQVFERQLQFIGNTLEEAVAALTEGNTQNSLLGGAQLADVTFTKASDGVTTLLGVSAVARVGIVRVTVTEAFADGGGTQTTFLIGETDDTDSFAAAASFTDAALGAVFYFVAPITAAKSVLVTADNAAGAGTGAIRVELAVLPAEV